MLFSFRTRTFINILVWYFHRCCIRQGSFTISWFNRFILGEKKMEECFVFTHRGNFQALKVRDLKLSYVSQLCDLKNWIISRNLNIIGDGTKNFQKYQLALWLSIQNFYSHFAKVTRKCKCFGRNVEPWYMKVIPEKCHINLHFKGYPQKLVFNFQKNKFL